MKRCVVNECDQQAEHRAVLEIGIAGSVAPAVFPFEAGIVYCPKHAKQLKTEDLVEEGGWAAIVEAFELNDLQAPTSHAVKTVRL